MKKQKGITLVALVITIIVLLILAGISIQALTNQGLFGRANDAKRESEIANIKEQIALDIYEKQLEPPLGSITEEQLGTILGKYGTVNKEDGKIVGITTGKGYEILLKDIYGGETVAESVPDGATVTPVNDITTWLKTGEISKQYSYTTIEQVIADSTCTESLMNNENAMKYLARSTEFADVICVNETTMTSLGKSAYVDDTVLNSDYWVSAICDSAYYDKVLNDLVPTMTSNSTPSGVASCSSLYNNNYAAYKAFDKLNENGWYTSTGSQVGQWLKYMFQKPVFIFTTKIFNIWSGSNSVIKIQGSNDDTTWNDLTDNITIQTVSISNTYQEVICKTTHNMDVKYKYWRLYVVSGTANDNGHGVNVSEAYIYGK